VVAFERESESLGHRIGCFDIWYRVSLFRILPDKLNMKFHPLAILLGIVADIVASLVSSVGLSFLMSIRVIRIYMARL
jgi:hypothetical protein